MLLLILTLLSLRLSELIIPLLCMVESMAHSKCTVCVVVKFKENSKKSIPINAQRNISAIMSQLLLFSIIIAAISHQTSG